MRRQLNNIARAILFFCDLSVQFYYNFFYQILPKCAGKWTCLESARLWLKMSEKCAVSPAHYKLSNLDLIQHERIRYTIICFISSCTAERRTACLEEVQRLKTADEDDTVSMKSEDMDEDLPCKATLKISGISLGKIT